MKNLSLFASAVVLPLLLIGCGPTDERASRYPVSGKVTQGGTPVAGATVTFVPKVNDGTPAFATTNDLGEFQLTSFESGDGAVPGDYHVKVEKYESSSTAGTGSSTEGTSELNTDNYEPDTDEPAEPKNLLPAKYSDPFNSGILVRVIEEDNFFEITLD